MTVEREGRVVRLKVFDHTEPADVPILVAVLTLTEAKRIGAWLQYHARRETKHQ